MKRIFVLATAALMFGSLGSRPVCAERQAPLTLGTRDASDFSTFPLAGRTETFLSHSDASFIRGKNEWTWVSDVEHVMWASTKETFLADPPHRYYLTGDRIPAGRSFELFPYHYYDEDYAKLSGDRPLNYRLVARNETTQPITLAVHGQGTVADWDHYKAWEGALSGNAATTVTLAPGETHTFWEARGLKPGLPWSAIVLGHTSGDLMVYNYAFLQEKDPGLEGLRPMPDLAWPPYLLASFSRGSVNWNSARIELLTRSRNGNGDIPVSALRGKVQSVAFGYSPGGPITDLCEYHAVSPTFARDSVQVKDPVTSRSHQFFGGNYPIRYKLRLPLANDSQATATVRLWLASNDIWNVDSIAGVWVEKPKQTGGLAWARVPALGRNSRWRAVTLELAPGAHSEAEVIIVPLGSRWGGLVASLDVAGADEKDR